MNYHREKVNQMCPKEHKECQTLAKTVTWDRPCGRVLILSLGKLAGRHFPAASEGGHGRGSFLSRTRGTELEAL